jgi:hypothetical protein
VNQEELQRYYNGTPFLVREMGQMMGGDDRVYHEDEDRQLNEQDRQCLQTIENNKRLLYRLFGQERLE